MEQLTRLGVEVRLNAAAEEASEEGLRVGSQWFPACVRVWAAGMEISDLVRSLSGVHDPSGRVEVDRHLTLSDHPEVYVLGDAGLYEDPRHGPLPPTGSVAVQQGPWAARDLGRRLRSKAARPPFRFFNRGYVVSLGPESAVAEALGVRLKGPAAQALYRGVLLYYLKSRRDRILAASDWAMERSLGRVGFGALS
jgi:NADH dehydrogenase